MNGISLYFHIPFCTSKCSYCDFYSITDYSTCPVLFRSLEQELAEDFLLTENAETASVYIGGGTPDSVDIRYLASLIKAINKTGVREGTEWTIEANPEHITPDFIALVNDTPVTRLSIGVQSFNERNLRILGRNAGLAQTFRGVDLACHSFCGEINIDLISEIPEQTLSSSLSDIKHAAEKGVSHISRYTLTLEEDTELYARYLETENENDQIYEAGIAYLEELGYGRYEISNFAKPGKECRHNLRYWHMDPYLGFGPSSVSTVGPVTLDGYGTLGHWIRREHGRSVQKYIDESKSTACRQRFQLEDAGGLWRLIEWKDLLYEQFIMGLRVKEGIEVNTVQARFPDNFYEVFRHICAACRELLDISETHVRIKDEYYDSQNRVLLRILDELDARVPQS